MASWRKVIQMDLNDLADRYVAVWNERDPEKRRRQIADLWIPQGEHYVESQKAIGYEELERRVRESQRFEFVPDRREEFLERLQYVLAEMKSEPTYYEAILHRDPQFENIFMLYETWESHDDVVNEQLNRPYRRAWHDALPRILEGEREICVWEPIKVDRKRL
jgi:quinol monooxygenase YgiN